MAGKSMIHYNMDFLVAALVLMLLLMHHFMTHKKLESTNNQIFRWFIWLGLLDVMLDICSSFLIMKAEAKLNGVAELITTFFYLVQILVVYAFMCYVKSLRDDLGGKLRNIILFWMIPSLLMGVMILMNHWNGELFYFTETGIYMRGPHYLWMYYFAFAYVALAAVDSILHYKELGLRKYVTIWMVLVVAGTCVGIQANSGELLTTGFGIGLAILILYLSISNPDGSTDSLTEVFDKQSFLQWFQEHVNRRKTIHLISVDIYRLRRVNKIYGVRAGDELLIKVAEMLQYLSKSNQVFRVTGNRFVIVLDSLSEYERIRDDVKTYFEKPFLIEGEEVAFPAIVCGIVDAQKLLESNTVLEYIDYLVEVIPDTEESYVIQGDAKTLEGFQKEQEIERFLEEAIEKDLFEVYYQPVYSISEKRYITLESLSRLRHPQLGYVPPDIFISIAERNGQITKIGYLQFRRICAFMKANQQIMEQIKNVKVNLSPAEILKNGYGKKLISVMKEFDLPPSYFQFEITETVATEYSEQLYRTIELFSEEGIGLCLDDFGSGYANLNTVLKLPFSSIKLDRSLLAGICEDSQVANFYENIVHILQNMGYLLIAEGVETKPEVELLMNWGVDMIQGYYFSRPVNEKEICTLLHNAREGNA